jgi:D-glycero-alpha-D-manno-heptose-7-phosphate kinase
LNSNKNESVLVKKINITAEESAFLSSSLILVKVGKSRKASTILNIQKENIKDEKVLNSIHEIQALVDPMFSALRKLDIKRIGEILSYNWELKTSLTKKTTNKRVNQTFDNISKVKGFYGGKLLGAGGSGYFLVAGNKNSIQTISNNFQTIKFSFDDLGTKIIIDS